MNTLEFIKDMLGRKLSLREINEKYGLLDCVETYMTVKQNYTEEQINNIIKEVYYDERVN